jgi:hypothetical protein
MDGKSRLGLRALTEALAKGPSQKGTPWWPFTTPPSPS